MDHLRFSSMVPNTTLQNQPTSTADSPSDEPMADADEPPDEPQPIATAESNVDPATDFKKVACPFTRKQSLLTRTFHTSESESQGDDDALLSGSTRAHSSASTWSRGSVASTAELTSDGHTSPARTGSPSPPLPPSTFQGLPPIFNQKPFDAPPTAVKIVNEPIDPLHNTPTPMSSNNEDAVEKGLGRKRCIMFACAGKTAAPKKEEQLPKQEEPKAETAPVKRPCALKFVCPSRGNTTPTATQKPHVRMASPPPPARRIPASPKPSSPKISRSHRSSDSTVRNESPKSVRKVPSLSRARKPSGVATEVPLFEATRFHEFASSEEERDDWIQEASCHRHRLTVQDTLRVEDNLRHVCEEAEDEAMEEEEEEEEAQLDAIEDDIDEDEEDDDDDDDDNQSLVDSTGYVTDDGFHTDDEEGFASSDDDESDDEYAWWAPRSGGPHVEHIRSSNRRSESGSSIGSFNSTRVFPSKTPKALKKSKTNPIEFRPRTPELPDSTDFVCGTLDEDKPLEEAWLSCRNQRRAANHRPCPQDIDPTFPASDPELDEEDEEGYEDAVHMDDSDSHFLIHGHPDLMSDIDAREPRSIVPKKRSPAVSPKRLRSPPPNKRVVHHSPPPRRLFGHSPRRMHSPPPRRPLRSPPPSRRTSFTNNASYDINATPIALAQRPRFDRAATSLPRNGPFPLRSGAYFASPPANDSDNDGDETQTESALPLRGAIDIVKGLEKKRQRRKEKLYEKHCRMRNKSKNAGKQPVILPGMGAEKMRQMGEGLYKTRGHGIMKKATEMDMMFGHNTAGAKGAHILSY